MASDKKHFPIADVRKVMAEAVERNFGAMTGVKSEYHNGILSVSIPKENDYFSPKVTLHLQDDLYGELVEGYYISYPSMWQSAEHAEKMAVLIGGVAAVGYALEKMGVEPRK